MYIRKNLATFLEKIPFEMKKPKHWRKFVNSLNSEYNLIIKHGNEYECTNCGKYFHSEQVTENSYKKTCPFCNNQYDVRRSNLKRYFFLYDLALIDSVDNKVIIRYFEVMRNYDYKIRRFKNDVVEYARIIPELDLELANDRYVKVLWHESIHHTKKVKKWRVFTGQYGLSQNYKRIYLDDIPTKLKGTKYEYSQIKEAIEYLNNNRVDLLKILKKAAYPSFELLMKLKLYNLALNCPGEFNQKGNFEKRFGVGKEYYNFMKRNNITYDELQVLKLTKIQNIKMIRKLLKISQNDVRDLEETQNYINLTKLYKYAIKQKNFYINNYLDYIDNMNKLGIPLINKILLPDNFTNAHDESVIKVTIVNNKLINKQIKERFKTLSKNEFSNKSFLIRPAKSLKDMKDEARQQNNCVYTNYSESYASGKTDIYFMRRKNDPNKSLVTVEVRDGKLRQKYQKGNIDVTKKQNEFLNLWEKEVIQKAA